MRKILDPNKFLADLILVDGYGLPADIIAFEHDVGGARIYVASKESVDARVAVMHFVRSEEITLDEKTCIRIGVRA
jgi:hypothetical protein